MALSNTRFTHLLIICLLSLGVAVACFFMGGIAAQVTSQPGAIVAFKAGGSVAGFLILFFALLQGYHRLGGAPLVLKVVVLADPAMKKAPGGYKVKCEIFKNASNAISERECSLTWEAGNPTVHLHNIEQDDLIMLRVISPAGQIWHTEHFSALCPLVKLQQFSG
jgi:hypothetical protein